MRTRGSISEYNQARAWIFLVAYVCMLGYLTHKTSTALLLDRSTLHSAENFSRLEAPVEFFVFAVFMARALYQAKKPLRLWITLCSALFLAAALGLYPLYLGTASFNLGSLLMSLLGALLGITAYELSLPKSQRQAWWPKPRGKTDPV